MKYNEISNDYIYEYIEVCDGFAKKYKVMSLEKK